MPSIDEATRMRGLTAVDRDGDKIGVIEEVYLDEETGRPEWLAIKTGLLGSKQSFAPIEGASAEGDAVTVPYGKSQVKDAPGVDPDGELSQEEEQRLYQHYGLDYGESRSDSGLPEGTTGASGDAITRSEEELRVGVAPREVGRARLRKYVVSEPVQEEVTTQREEVRLEREPVTDANVHRATRGELSEEEHEVTLSAEEPVVEKRVVPKERVRLDKDVVSEQETVSDEVRKEVVDEPDVTHRDRS
jgi:stress response protein YsnF